MDAEAAALLACLDRQRDHVLSILEGLSEEQLRRLVLPSGWHCLGMVRHLALADERYWFRCIVAGESLDYFPQGERAEWHVDPSDSPENVFQAYRDEIRHANAVIETTPLDAPPRQTDGWWGEWKLPDLRFVMLHVIAETACHAGHLDAARELLDGRQWIAL